METLLREIEAQLAAMTPEDRARCSDALVGLVDGARAFGRYLKLKASTGLWAITYLGAQMGARRTLGDILVDARKIAPKAGPHVTAICDRLKT